MFLRAWAGEDLNCKNISSIVREGLFLQIEKIWLSKLFPLHFVYEKQRSGKTSFPEPGPGDAGAACCCPRGVGLQRALASTLLGGCWRAPVSAAAAYRRRANAVAVGRGAHRGGATLQVALACVMRRS